MGKRLQISNLFIKKLLKNMYNPNKKLLKYNKWLYIINWNYNSK